MSESEQRLLNIVLRNRKHFAMRPVLREIYNVAYWANQGNPVAYAQALNELEQAERLYEEAEQIVGSDK